MTKQKLQFGVVRKEEHHYCGSSSILTINPGGTSTSMVVLPKGFGGGLRQVLHWGRGVAVFKGIGKDEVFAFVDFAEAV
ncbi:conserved hypothetical protein [Aspergillus fumigatus A1163]|uniref:Uncharacterized protein n=1 Tax=Aspergillus fumigatus (strain CBS 144.89 / FGSC A1163 / CEA10) TaxID=451804 RepID=B0Y9L9_ASPFC|nr:conserved hypothetical protein [Aspergillus fumigatus A1163]